MRFALLAPCHDTASLAPTLTTFDPDEVEVVVLPSRRDGHVPCDDGVMSQSTTDDMLDELAWRGPWDGVLVVLDASAGEDRPAARQVAQRVRRILGPDVPVGTVDDARADIADQLSEGLTVLRTLRTIALDPAAGPASW
ncbi:MAG: hypothetical protein GEU97_10930 [Actinophytocola sp.]|nr:hypothetical protein [Actinophytocola sp.]